MKPISLMIKRRKQAPKTAHPKRRDKLLRHELKVALVAQQLRKESAA